MKIYIGTKKAARRWLLRTLEPCQVMVPLMSESLERRLGLIEHMKLELHLLVCAWCAQYLKQIRMLGQLLGQPDCNRDDENDVPPKLTDEARQRIAESLRRRV